MMNSVDKIIQQLDSALAEHRRVFSRGIAAADPNATRKANDAIGNASDLAYKELGLTVGFDRLSNDQVMEKLRERSRQLADAKRLQDIAAAPRWRDLLLGDIRRTVAQVASQSADGYSWPDCEQFLKILKLPDSPQWQTHYKQCTHVYRMYIGKWAGWWELSWDMFPDDEDLKLFPIQLTVISMAETKFKSFASLVADLGLFKSTNEAKKNGWNRPIELGDFLFKKKTYILRIVE